MMAEGGGAGVEARDDRGYVEPEPEVFARLASLVEATAAGLAGYGLLGETDAQNLGILQELATRLEAIARKELANELPTDDEFELIRSFGVQIEHFWQEVHKDEVPEGEYLTTFEFPSAIVADVASDPNGQVLEVGTGEVSTIYAVVPVEGSLRLASGSVYSYYEFPWPLGDRLTDAAWLRLLGMDNMDSRDLRQASGRARELDRRLLAMLARLLLEQSIKTLDFVALGLMCLSTPRLRAPCPGNFADCSERRTDDGPCGRRHPRGGEPRGVGGCRRRGGWVLGFRGLCAGGRCLRGRGRPVGCPARMGDLACARLQGRRYRRRCARRRPRGRRSFRAMGGGGRGGRAGLLLSRRVAGERRPGDRPRRRRAARGGPAGMAGGELWELAAVLGRGARGRRGVHPAHLCAWLAGRRAAPSLDVVADGGRDRGHGRRCRRRARPDRSSRRADPVALGQLGLCARGRLCGCGRGGGNPGGTGHGARSWRRHRPRGLACGRARRRGRVRLWPVVCTGRRPWWPRPTWRSWGRRPPL